MGKLSLLSVALILACHGTTDASVAQVEAKTRSHSHSNIYGLPVLDEAGERLTYTRDELKGLPEQLRPETGNEASELAGDLINGREVPVLQRPLWTFPLLMSGVGLNIWAGETADGTMELYVGSGTTTFGSNTYWAALNYDSATNTYQPFFSSQYFPSNIMDLEVGDVTGDGAMEIVVAAGNGEVHLYDQVSKQWLSSFQAVPSLQAMRVVNIDGTGKSEVVVCNSNMTAVYQDGALQWSASAGGNDLTVGQMDGDAALEIGLASGKVIDCGTRMVQWDRGNAFGARVHSADIDSDGMAEIVSAEAWYYVWAFDVDIQVPKWSVRTSTNITALALTDFDKNGVVEIAIGDGQWGRVWAIDPVTQNLKYSIPNPESAVSGIVAADLDRDGTREIIWGSGIGSTGQDYLVVANPNSNVTEWTSVHLDAPVVGPEKGDLDGDGEDEIVAASYESASGYSSGRILVFDALTMKLRAMSAPIVGGSAWEGLRDLKLRDVDKDGEQEILIGADNTYDGKVEIYDFNTSNVFTLKWTTPGLVDGSPFSVVDAYDLDDDGDMEIIAGNDRAHTGSSGTYVRVYDYQTKALESTSFHLGGSWYSVDDIAIEDLDTSAGVELVAMVGGDDIYIFDGKTKAAKAVIPGSFTSMRVKDKEIFACDGQGYLRRYKYAGPGYAETTSTIRLIAGPVDGFTVLSSNPLSVVFGSGGSLRHYENGAVQAQSANYGSPYGKRYVDGLSAGLFSVTANVLPAPVMVPEGAVTTGTANTVAWSRVQNAEEFLVEAAIDSSFTAPISSGWQSELNKEFTGLTPGATYYYRAKARAYDGLTESAWSRPVSSQQEAAPAAVANWTLY